MHKGETKTFVDRIIWQAHLVTFREQKRESQTKCQKCNIVICFGAVCYFYKTVKKGHGILDQWICCRKCEENLKTV